MTENELKMSFEDAIRFDRHAKGTWKRGMPFTLDQWLRARDIINQAAIVLKIDARIGTKDEWPGDAENLTVQKLRLRALENGEKVKSHAREMEDLGYKKRPMWEKIPEEPEDEE